MIDAIQDPPLRLVHSRRKVRMSVRLLRGLRKLEVSRLRKCKARIGKFVMLNADVARVRVTVMLGRPTSRAVRGSGGKTRQIYNLNSYMIPNFEHSKHPSSFRYLCEPGFQTNPPKVIRSILHLICVTFYMCYVRFLHGLELTDE